MVGGLASASVQASGFGDISVASELGQPLRATVRMTGSGMTDQAGSCFVSYLKSLTGTLIATPSITVTPGRQSALLALSTVERITEPAVSLFVENNCGNTVRREFELLLDPPVSRYASLSGMTSSVSALPLIGPSSNIRRGPRSDDRLRRFIIAKQKSDIQRDKNTRMADSSTAAARTTVPELRNALHLSAPGDNTAGMTNTGGLRLALADRLGSPAPSITQANNGQFQRAQSTTQQNAQSAQREEIESGRPEQDTNRYLLAIIGSMLVLSLGIIALLRSRIKHQKQPAAIWDWEDQEQYRVRSVFDREPTMPKNHETHEAQKLHEAHDFAPASLITEPSPSSPSPKTAQPTFKLEQVVKGPIQRYGFYATLPMPPVANPKSDLQQEQQQHEAMHFPELPVASTALEEISDVMEEAEFWISLKDAKRAIDVLEPYANVERPGSPLPWLYLFDLYMELDSRQQYDVLRDRFHQVFNAKILTWDDQLRANASSDQTPAERSIEDIPHVKSKITSLWQSEEIVPYLESLLVDDRYGTRAGFTLSIFQEIMFLIALANTIRISESTENYSPQASGWKLELSR